MLKLPKKRCFDPLTTVYAVLVLLWFAAFGWSQFRSTRAIVFTDTTGCQYLWTDGGGMTPRLDSAGRQICLQPLKPKENENGNGSRS